MYLSAILSVMDDHGRPDEQSTLWADAWRGVLFASSRTLRIAEPELIADAGFPLTWLDILSRLYDAPERKLRMQDLEGSSLFTRSGLTRLVDRVERAGLVHRESVPGDRRGVLVVLTDEGARRYVAAFTEHLRVIEREFGNRLTTDQQRAVADALAGFWREVDSTTEG